MVTRVIWDLTSLMLRLTANGEMHDILTWEMHDILTWEMHDILTDILILLIIVIY